MMLKCNECGYECDKSAFRYIGLTATGGSDTYRKCPKCNAPVFCEEIADGDQSSSKKIWGAGPLRGQAFKRKNRKPGRPFNDRSLQK